MPNPGIYLAPYDPAWPGLFEEERALLEPAMESWLAGLSGRFHHTVSVSPPSGVIVVPVM